MKPGDARKLLGGYAASTLTGEERRALFEAALADQDLFDELGREQALKELLDDPGARRRLLDALEEPASLVARVRAWMGRPLAWAAAGSLAAAVVLVVVMARRQAEPPPPEPVLMAKLETEKAPESRAAAEANRDSPPATRQRVESPRLPREKGAIESESKSVPAGVVPPPADKPAEMRQTVDVTAEAAPAQLAKSEERDALVDARKDAAPAADALLPRSAAASGAAPGAAPGAAQGVVGGVVGGVGRMGGAAFRIAAATQPVPYKILRAGADGRFADADSGTVFRSDDRVRVVFGPLEDGRLLVTVAGRPAPLLDSSAARGAESGVDIPAGVERITVLFTPRSDPQARAQMAAGGRGSGGAFEIRIPREPGP
jgi:hypothetical protein